VLRRAFACRLDTSGQTDDFPLSNRLQLAWFSHKAIRMSGDNPAKPGEMVASKPG
jgi:hypothetical protein